MNRRQIYTVIVSFLVLIVLVNVANAQSKDRDNPTQLTSSEISSLIGNESKGSFYYYSFTANPGEVSIILSLQPDSPDTGVQQVRFTLYDRNAKAILSNFVTTSGSTGTGQVVGRVTITLRQTVVLSISIPNYTSGTGKYRLRIGGSVELGQNKSNTESENLNPFASALEANRLEREKDNLQKCLPKQGTLILKMKDGSKKIIDLSEAETITVVP